MIKWKFQIERILTPNPCKRIEENKKLKERDIIRLKGGVALLNMEAGDYYRVEYIKKRYYEDRCFLSKCDERGVIKEGDMIDLAVRELDFWINEGSLEVTSSE